MKKIYLTLFIAFVFGAAIAQVPFTAGNLVVLRTGDGTTVASGASAPTFLDEYTATGTLVQSIALSTGANPLSITLGSTSEGYISRSVDKLYILVPGYAAPAGTTSIVATTSAATNRAVAIVDVSANIDMTTKLTDAFSAGNIRSVASIDGNKIWLAGSNTSTRYTTKGSTTSTQIGNPPTNARVVSIQNGQLYLTAASNPYFGVATIGIGTPETTGQTVTTLNGFPITTGPSPYAYSFNDAGTVVYVADDRTAVNGGGVQKWTFDGTIWTLQYTLNTGPVRGIAVDWTTPATPTIYATSSGTILSIVDAGVASTPTTIVPAASNIGYRGLTYAPENFTQPVKLNGFNAQKLSNNSVSISWGTEQEFNSKSFVIQRSNNGSNWSDISTTPAAGNSNSVLNYSATDNSPSNGFNYYRLKQVSEDGSITYSEIRKVLFSINYKVMVTPNPAKGFINVYISKNNNTTNTIVNVIDMNGKIVRSESSALSTISIPTSGIAKGTYFVKIVNANNVTTKKISIQ